MMTSVEKNKKYENEFSEFLLKRIANAGGSLQFQQISGHLSQIRPEVRKAVGTSQSDLMQFLRRHKNLFDVNNSVVSLVKSCAVNTSGYESDDSVASHSNLPKMIKIGKGVVTKIFREYGFIKSKEPIKTEIYFTSLVFGNKDIDLTSFLFIGTIVFFDAEKQSNAEVRSKYKATRVWKADESGFESSIVQKPRKTRETGLYDQLNLESEGIIQNVFPNMGFIAVKGDNNNTVFFHKNRVVNYDNIVDLTKVLSIGDRVEFNAHRSTKSNSKARWEATKVWKVSGKVKQNILKSDSIECNNNLPVQSMADIKAETKETKKNQHGKIYPRSKGAVIKFGDNELADGDSAVYYICGSQVTEIAWEFSEGDDVFFDAVKIKSDPGWKALLVWVDTKPDIVLPTGLEDFSEFTDEDENGEICSSIYTSKSSSYISRSSSSSSLKSESVKSESKYSMKYNSLKSPDFADNKKLKDNVKKLNEIHDTLLQDSLSTSLISDNSQQLKNAGKYSFTGKFVSEVNETVSNWGDSPYPVDDDYENLSAHEDYAPLETAHNSKVEVTDVNIDNKTDYECLVEEKTDVLNKECSSSFKTQNNEYMLNVLKNSASIKKFNNVEGEVNKVYSKFAEVRSYNVLNAVSFYWNDLYCDGMSVEELELDDLKEVLKVGDKIKFNYFVIVDDSGQNWQRVTMAWKGSKPKCQNEMSPKDFIKHHNLSVTINDQLDVDEVQENGIAQRKFLTSFVDSIPKNSCNKLSEIPSCPKKESSIAQQSFEPCRTLFPTDFENLTFKVCQILKTQLFVEDSEVDSSSVSEEIVNMILESSKVKKIDAEICKALSQEDTITRSSDEMCSNCREKGVRVICKTINAKDCEVQTIITGDIIAQNIFPEW